MMETGTTGWRETMLTLNQLNELATGELEELQAAIIGILDGRNPSQEPLVALEDLAYDETLV